MLEAREMEKAEDKLEEKEHKIVVDIVMFGKFSGDLPIETALRTRLWNAARFDGKFDVKYVRMSVGEIVKNTAICENEPNDDDE